MAYFVLILLILVISGLIGTAISSRARSEKRSIAGFHQQMGQLSGVVQSDSQNEQGAAEAEQGLFGEVPSHVRVIGKVDSAKSLDPLKGKPGRMGGTKAAPSLLRRNSVSGVAPRSSGEFRGQRGIIGEEPPAPTSASSGEGDERNIEPVRRRRSASLSSDRRADGSRVKTEILQFDDDSSAQESAVTSGLPGSLGRKLNVRVLAVASIVGLIGLGAIAMSLSDGHSTAPGAVDKNSAPPTSQSVITSRATTKTTLPPHVSTGVLMPASADSSGATYYIDSPTITLVLQASAPSWVEESVSPGSTILWDGTIPAGGSKTLTLNSSMWIKTGNVDVLTITANGRPVHFSASPGVYSFTFTQGVKA